MVPHEYQWDANEQNLKSLAVSILNIFEIFQNGFHHWTRHPHVFLFSIYTTKSKISGCTCFKGEV